MALPEWPPRRGMEQPRGLFIALDPPVSPAKARALPAATVSVSRRSRSGCVGFVFSWSGPEDGAVAVTAAHPAAAVGFPDAWKMVRIAEDPATGEGFYRRLAAEWKAGQ